MCRFPWTHKFYAPLILFVFPFFVKVISLNKLHKNYHSFEAKRQLCSLYDVFLCDDAIYHLLPKVLGKTFFSKKK